MDGSFVSLFVKLLQIQEFRRCPAGIRLIISPKLKIDVYAAGEQKSDMAWEVLEIVNQERTANSCFTVLPEEYDGGWSGENHYITNVSERDSLVSIGWRGL